MTFHAYFHAVWFYVIFHVHTFRCKHASDETDEDYVKTALDLGAEKISFTDHTPFPGNPFGHRMSMEELPEYIASLKKLRNKYEGKIDIEIGLEVEFLPSQIAFYQGLKNKFGLELLIIGQHYYEHEDGTYSFNDDKEFNQANEFIGCGNAMIEGMKTGLFKVAAHPDRIFRRCKGWSPEMTKMARRIIEVAAQNGVRLEKNLSSYEKFLEKSHFIYWREEFWDLVEEYNLTAARKVETIVGFDAHSTDDLKRRYSHLS